MSVEHAPFVLEQYAIIASISLVSGCETFVKGSYANRTRTAQQSPWRFSLERSGWLRECLNFFAARGRPFSSAESSSRSKMDVRRGDLSEQPENEKRYSPSRLRKNPPFVLSLSKHTNRVFPQPARPPCPCETHQRRFRLHRRLPGCGGLSEAG